ncbi:hypothetical protein CCH79_00014510 [Gambusia affinis]|uniref:RRM domain-containing protein n=1 Tax=Gambusia affinis TaxID=33528 RepID=A0A315UTK3_GAMAF|nr:hypothetical protein CCH79_00014510 [Gambusia affinis]
MADQCKRVGGVNQVWCQIQNPNSPRPHSVYNGGGEQSMQIRVKGFGNDKTKPRGLTGVAATSASADFNHCSGRLRKHQGASNRRAWRAERLQTIPSLRIPPASSLTSVSLEFLSISLLPNGPYTGATMVKIFIGNLSPETTREDIEELFVKYGIVTECAKYKNYAFVHMEDRKSATKAIRELHLHKLNGRSINVEPSRGKNQGPVKLHIANVEKGFDKELRDLFEEFGTVTECSIVKNFAFVHMPHYEEAMDALEGLDNLEFQGKRIHVQVSKSRPRGGPEEEEEQYPPPPKYRARPFTAATNYDDRRAIPPPPPPSSALVRERLGATPSVDPYERRALPTPAAYAARDRSPIRRIPPPPAPAAGNGYSYERSRLSPMSRAPLYAAPQHRAIPPPPPPPPSSVVRDRLMTSPLNPYERRPLPPPPPPPPTSYYARDRSPIRRAPNAPLPPPPSNGYAYDRSPYTVPPMVKIFVGNLPQEATEDEIKELFEEHGTVTECAIIKNFAFVHMDDRKAATKAIRTLHQHKLHGTAINVEASHGKNQGPVKLHVANVEKGADDELRALFEEYGTVTECAVVKNFAFVHMPNYDEAMDAIKGLDNSEFQGKKKHLEVARNNGYAYERSRLSPVSRAPAYGVPRAMDPYAGRLPPPPARYAY